MVYQRREKAAIVRILTDLVKSDSVISVKELDSLDNFFEYFGVDDEDKVSGFGITMQEAFLRLRESSKGTRDKVIEAMNGIANADNDCCRAEAMLIVAVKYALGGKMDKNVTVYSMPFRNRPILDSQVLFIENPSTRGIRYKGDVLRNTYEHVSNIIEAAGFDLVYIPEISKRLTEWDGAEGRGNLERVFRLISPTLAKDKISIMVENAKGMTTKKFYDDVLRSSEGLEMPIEITKPSWMVRLCNSTLNGIGYANFMCMELEYDAEADRKDQEMQIRKQMHRFVDDINELQGPYTIMANRHRRLGEDFQYGGFYKVLFDVMLGRKPEEWTLWVYPQKYSKENSGGHKCQFTIMDKGKTSSIPITGMDAAFYLMVLCCSRHGGLNTNNSSLMQKMFSAAYRYMSTRDVEMGIPDITKSTTFRQVKHRIHNAISNVDAAVDHNLELITKDGRLTLNVNLADIRISGIGVETDFEKSEIFRTISSIISKA